MRILLVCSGNTCRSPLAAVMLREKVAAAPEFSDVTITSAGTAAWDGAPASEGSYLVALERGLDLSEHRARMLTTDDVHGADLILTMNDSQALRAASLGGGDKVYSLAAYAGFPDGRREVQDPHGGDVEGYRRVAEVLDDLLSRAIERLRAERRP